MSGLNHLDQSPSESGLCVHVCPSVSVGVCCLCINLMQVIDCSNEAFDITFVVKLSFRTSFTFLCLILLLFNLNIL